jgi:hypothetical protein
MGGVSLFFSLIVHNILTIEIVTGVGFSKFVRQYRQIVPDTYNLFLFREGDDQSIIILPQTTVQEISSWTGLP